jgi:DNA-binding MarR family transcriptional regulator
MVNQGDDIVNGGIMADQNHELQALRETHIGRLLLRAHRAFSQRAADLLHARGYPGVTLRHIDLLPYLDAGGTRATVLAQRAGMTKQGMGKLVAELGTQGLVERAPDPADGRAQLVRFTPAGLRFLAVAVEVVHELEGEYLVILGPERLDALKRSLADIVDHST